ADLGNRYGSRSHARPGAGRDRLHPRAGRRSLARAVRADPCAVWRKRQGRERRRAAGPPRHRWRTGRRREPGSRLVRGDRLGRWVMTLAAGPGSLPATAVALIVLDGWG